MALIFLCSTFVISTCGLVYELVNGALASYLLGDSVTQFSTVIGVYLFAMGIGSYCTRHLRRRLLETFVGAQILVGVIGGMSSPLLFVLFERVAYFRVALYFLVSLTGILVGLEIPLLLRILKDEYEFKDLLARVFAVDYVGALLASVLFPLLLVPHLGLLRTSLFFGVLNVLVAGLATSVLDVKSGQKIALRFGAGAALIILVLAFVGADEIQSFAEAAIFPGQPVFATTTAYQRIVITHQENDLRLFLNQHLQFSSRDEYRYHESLVHPGLAAVSNPERVLVLGGGDGMAVREILKNSRVQSVTQVELDPEMTRIFSTFDFLTRLNGNALNSPKTHILNADAFVWVREHPEEKFDFIVLDFPDPANYSIGKLYTLTFFRLLRAHLRAGGRLVVQSTSPLAARKSFWCVAHTLRAAGFMITPYHVYVPSFGEWGFVVAGEAALENPAVFPDKVTFVNKTLLASMEYFPFDMSEVPTEINRLNNQALVRYYEAEWSEFMVN